MMRPGLFSPRKLVQKFVPMMGEQGISARFFPGFAKPVHGEAGPEDYLSLGRVGSLEVRLARTAREVKKAQRLRYHVFYEEMSAIADAQTLATRRDMDAFDAICDHLLVVDHAAMKRNKLGRLQPQIVGTYRLLRQEVAEAHGGFYTASEYDIQPLVDANPNLRFLELGRSCVLKPYRNKRTVELLWHGIWAYVIRHRIDVMIGCASIEGTDPDRIAGQLSFLHHHARAPEPWRVRAVESRYVEMNRIPREELNDKATLRELPPLVKGYLRLGAHIGDGAVVDHQFGTTDILIVLPVSQMNERYVNHYGADASRYAS
jgi:putative hemolysin